MMCGLFESWRQPNVKTRLVSGFVDPSNSGAKNAAGDSTENKAALSILPHERTLLFQIVQTIGTCDGVELASLLSVLEPLSLPGKSCYSGLLQPILNGGTSPSVQKTACVRLLLSQTTGRRKVVFDGTAFLQAATRLAKVPAADFHSQFGGDAPTEFVTALPDFLLKCTTDSVESVLHGTHATSVEGWNEELISQWMVAVRKLLKMTNSRSMSPKTLTTLRRCLITRVFEALTRYYEALGTERTSTVLNAYVDCLVEIPCDFLEREGSFRLALQQKDGSEGLVASDCLLSLVERGYFVSKDEALSTVSTCVSRLAAGSAPQRTTLPTAFLAAAAARSVPTKSQNKIVHVLLDALLVQGLHGAGIVMLAAMASRRAKAGRRSSVPTLLWSSARYGVLPPSLNTYSEALLDDLPFNLMSTLTVDGNMISNKVVRILNSAKKRGTSKHDLLKTTWVLHEVLVVLKDESTEGQALVSKWMAG